MQKKAKYGMNLSIAHFLYANPSNDLSEKDYYPFGMVMPERSFSSTEYSFGFNGQEKDDELKGSGNSYNFTFRMYDSRLGRFLSVDPIGKNYPHSSPFAFAENSPIQCIDLEGLEKYKVTGRSFIPMATLTNPWYTPNFSATSFAGDNRMSYELNTTAFRTEQKVNVDFDKRSVSYSNNTASGTKALDKAGKVIETSEEAPAGPVPTFDKSFLQNGTSVTIHMSIAAPNRLVSGAPAINYQFDVVITPSADKKTFEYQIKGAADGFPAYELWITDETNNKSYLLFNRTPTETGETPRALFPPMEHKYNLKGKSSDKTPATTVPFTNTTNSPECKDDGCN
ncbi:MAG: DUF3238 domain-containing protein [Chitinophagaceae bacterium]|nr:DUF3238 domain-containing protein [Chitinophagaceae bacterium]